MPRGPNYTVIPNDWQNLEYIISDLCNRIIDEDAAFSDYLLKDGTRALTADWNAGAFAITAKNFISSAAIGTSPYACTSTTLNTNLNADLLDGQHGSYYAIAVAGGYVPYTGATGSVNLGAFGLTAASITNTGLTITRVPFVSTGGLLADSSALTFNSGTGALSATSFSGGNVTSGVDPGHTHSSYLTAETDDLADVVARGADAGATINVGASNTLTLASGSITDSTGAIDFGNENLTTTGYGRFDGGLGIGVAPSSNSLINFSVVIDSTASTGIGLTSINTYNGPSPFISIAKGINFVSYWKPDDVALAKTCSVLNGGYAVTRLDTTNITSAANMTVTAASGYYGQLVIFKGGSHTGNATIITGAAFWAENPINITGGVLTNNYAFYDIGQTSGTNNWGLGINTANNYINGSLSINKNTAPTVPLDVVGAILNTTTIEAGTGFRCGGTAAVADGTYTTGIGGTTNGTITVKGGIITAVQEAVA